MTKYCRIRTHYNALHWSRFLEKQDYVVEGSPNHRENGQTGGLGLCQAFLAYTYTCSDTAAAARGMVWVLLRSAKKMLQKYLERWSKKGLMILFLSECTGF